jgi:hypothetical protein
MQLEKRNETVWSIKRKEHPGRFILRATEEGGKVINVAIGLENGENAITFQMNQAEFQNFYGIVSSFKELVESPENFEAETSNEKDQTNLSPKIPPPLSLDGTGIPLENTQNNDLLDEGLASLESLDQGNVMAPKAKDNPEKYIKPVQIQPKPQETLATPKIPIKAEPPKASQPKEESSKNKLKETDWDPW